MINNPSIKVITATAFLCSVLSACSGPTAADRYYYGNSNPTGFYDYQPPRYDDQNYAAFVDPVYEYPSRYDSDFNTPSVADTLSAANTPSIAATPSVAISSTPTYSSAAPEPAKDSMSSLAENLILLAFPYGRFLKIMTLGRTASVARTASLARSGAVARTVTAGEGAAMRVEAGAALEAEAAATASSRAAVQAEIQPAINSTRVGFADDFSIGWRGNESVGWRPTGTVGY
jgi:hypothetical protein